MHSNILDTVLRLTFQFIAVDYNFILENILYGVKLTLAFVRVLKINFIEF